MKQQWKKGEITDGTKHHGVFCICRRYKEQKTVKSMKNILNYLIGLVIVNQFEV